MANKFLKSSNPVLKKAVTVGHNEGGSRVISSTGSAIMTETMTVQGAINKTIMLFGIMMCTTLIAYQMATPFLLYVGMFGGLAVMLFASFKPHTSAIAAPFYAALEGLFVGAISYMYAASFAGIVLQAVMLTFGTLITMLLIYKFEIIKVTDKFRSVIVMATGAIMLAYAISFIMGMMGMQTFFLHQTGLLGIGISVVIIGVASMNLLLDFDNFEKGEAAQAPQYMEWFFAMGLLVTLVWLYVEFLRLLSILNQD